MRRLHHSQVLVGRVEDGAEPASAIQEHLDADTKAGWQLDHFSTNTHYNGTIMHSFIWGGDSEKPQPARRRPPNSQAGRSLLGSSDTPRGHPEVISTAETHLTVIA